MQGIVYKISLIGDHIYLYLRSLISYLRSNTHPKHYSLEVPNTVCVYSGSHRINAIWESLFYRFLISDFNQGTEDANKWDSLSINLFWL